MIRYDLVCDRGHAFDGWFRDSQGFEDQAAAKTVQCPHCGSSDVEKALMAPGVPARSNRRSGPSEDSMTDPRAVMMRTAMRKLREHVEATADYVGPQFADEARRIHNKESEERGIYGEASPEEARALRDEGIDVMPLPPDAKDQN